MILTIAFCEKDTETTVRLARWIAELGGVEKHDCLLGYHMDTTPTAVADILTPCFRRIGAFQIVEEAVDYPEIANMMWKACVNKIADGFKEPWLWMEPDAVPLVPEWLDRIEAEYGSAGKPFMLDRVVTPTRAHNSGVGVYPGDVRKYTQKLWRLTNTPWDVFFADDFTPFTHHTGLIHDKFYQVWDDTNSGPPVFPTMDSLKIIEGGAVLFHRNKEGSLIERIRESRGIRKPPVVVKPEVKTEPISQQSPPDLNDVVLRLERCVAAIERRLDTLLCGPAANGVAASAPAKSGDEGVSVSPPTLKPPRRRGKPPKKQRTPEQVQAAKDRMAKARAARKPAMALA